MDLGTVKRAYRLHAPYYDTVFGFMLDGGRKLVLEKSNALPGTRILEVGVGTGLSLPGYAWDKRIIGIDISAEMLARARRRAAEQGLRNVDSLMEMDAENLEFADDSFDIVVAMYVASVVSDPARLLREVERVCVPGGDILIVNHFASDNGLRGRVERLLAPLSNHLGWHPDFALEPFLGDSRLEILEKRRIPPFGLMTLLHCRNAKHG